MNKIIYLDSVDSTNKYILENCSKCASVKNIGALNEFDAVYSLNQTGGKGRHGRAWGAGGGKGLAFSILIKKKSVNNLGFLSLLQGYAILRELNKLGVHSYLKWPNDVYISSSKKIPYALRGGCLNSSIDKKISGTLSILSADAENIALGSGINIAQSAYDLKEYNATSIFLEIGDIENVSCETFSGEKEICFNTHKIAYDIVIGVLRFIKKNINNLDSPDLQNKIKSACKTLGSRIKVILSDRSYIAVAKDIAQDGSLIIEAYGKIYPVYAADIIHIRPA